MAEENWREVEQTQGLGFNTISPAGTIQQHVLSVLHTKDRLMINDS